MEVENTLLPLGGEGCLEAIRESDGDLHQQAQLLGCIDDFCSTLCSNER